jgi:hypothetical protein
VADFCAIIISTFLRGYFDSRVSRPIHGNKRRFPEGPTSRILDLEPELFTVDSSRRARAVHVIFQNNKFPINSDVSPPYIKAKETNVTTLPSRVLSIYILPRVEGHESKVRHLPAASSSPLPPRPPGRSPAPRRPSSTAADSASSSYRRSAAARSAVRHSSRRLCALPLPPEPGKKYLLVITNMLYRYRYRSIANM